MKTKIIKVLIESDKNGGFKALIFNVNSPTVPVWSSKRFASAMNARADADVWIADNIGCPHIVWDYINKI